MEQTDLYVLDFMFYTCEGTKIVRELKKQLRDMQNVLVHERDIQYFREQVEAVKNDLLEKHPRWNNAEVTLSKFGDGVINLYIDRHRFFCIKPCRMIVTNPNLQIEFND